MIFTTKKAQLSTWWKAIGWRGREVALDLGFKALVLTVAATTVGFIYPGFATVVAVLLIVLLGLGLYFKLAEIPQQEYRHKTRRTAFGK
jgi:hypothetical protein